MRPRTEGDTKRILRAPQLLGMYGIFKVKAKGSWNMPGSGILMIEKRLTPFNVCTVGTSKILIEDTRNSLAEALKRADVQRC